MAPLRVVWATLDGLTGKRLAPFMAEASHAALEIALVTNPAATQNRLCSSIPVTTLSSVPSSSSTPPMTSICHSPGKYQVAACSRVIPSARQASGNGVPDA